MLIMSWSYSGARYWSEGNVDGSPDPPMAAGSIHLPKVPISRRQAVDSIHWSEHDPRRHWTENSVWNRRQKNIEPIIDAPSTDSFLIDRIFLYHSREGKRRKGVGGGKGVVGECFYLRWLLDLFHHFSFSLLKSFRLIGNSGSAPPPSSAPFTTPSTRRNGGRFQTRITRKLMIGNGSNLVGSVSRYPRASTNFIRIFGTYFGGDSKR